MCGVLIDTSGTYTEKVEGIIKQIRIGILPSLSGGDTLVVMKIDSASYGWDNLIAEIKIPSSRQKAAGVKKTFADTLATFEPEAAKHTDISGALLYCNEYLKDLAPKSSRKVVIFSDMLEDLPRGTKRTFREDEFDDLSVAVVNTKRLSQDQQDPMAYRERMAEWEEKLKTNGAASFKVYMGTSQIKTFLESKHGP